MELSFKELLILAEGSALSAGTHLKTHKAAVVTSVGKDIKVDTDYSAHQIIVESLQKSAIPILSEEDIAHNFEKNLQWIVDPLDGSLNFLRGIPFCAVSIALVRNGEPVLGVVHDFLREEMFSGIVGEGAWLNGEAISVSNTKEKGEAVLMTGFPSYTDYSTTGLEKYVTAVQSFKKVRLIGSAALSLAYVAAGRADAYFEKDIKIWDVAAGLALVKSAGGVYNKTSVAAEGKCMVSAGNAEDLLTSL